MAQILKIVFPAEWERQCGVVLTWPHRNTDWFPIFDEVIPVFISIAEEIAKREKLIIAAPDVAEVQQQLKHINASRIIYRKIDSNDSWARDHSAISIFANDVPYILDFTFNGWGLKFPANHDNQITRKLYESGAFSPTITYRNMMHLVLEGGSIESDGKGTLLTTSECLLSANRNEYRSKSEIDDYLKLIFGAERILWLNHGYLVGDDTDSHIDTLARFCSPETIAYVKSEDPEDEHFEELSLMEKELQMFRTSEGSFYELIPLPMADPVYFEGERLPATYANFLIINDAVLMPGYGSPKDAEAKKQLQKAFLEQEVVVINCLPLIKQHGSLHCVTMQFPERFF